MLKKQLFKLEPFFNFTGSCNASECNLVLITLRKFKKKKKNQLHIVGWSKDQR